MFVCELIPISEYTFDLLTTIISLLEGILVLRVMVERMKIQAVKPVVVMMAMLVKKVLSVVETEATKAADLYLSIWHGIHHMEESP